MFSREPVAVANTFRLAVIAAITFGLPLTDAQFVAVMALFEAVLTLLTRAHVSPNAVVHAALDLPPGSTMADAVAISKQSEEPARA